MGRSGRWSSNTRVRWAIPSPCALVFGISNGQSVHIIIIQNTRRLVWRKMPADLLWVILTYFVFDSSRLSVNVLARKVKPEWGTAISVSVLLSLSSLCWDTHRLMSPSSLIATSQRSCAATDIFRATSQWVLHIERCELHLPVCYSGESDLTFSSFLSKRYSAYMGIGCESTYLRIETL